MGVAGSTHEKQGGSSGVVERSGLLVTDGALFWRTRFFVLFEDAVLDLYTSEDAFRSGASPVAKLDLFGGAVLFVREPKVSAAVAAKPCLEINTTHRTVYAYSPDGRDDIEQWAEALNAAAVRRSSAPPRRRQQQKQREREGDAR